MCISLVVFNETHLRLPFRSRLNRRHDQPIIIHKRVGKSTPAPYLSVVRKPLTASEHAFSLARHFADRRRLLTLSHFRKSSRKSQTWRWAGSASCCTVRVIDRARASPSREGRGLIDRSSECRQVKIVRDTILRLAEMGNGPNDPPSRVFRNVIVNPFTQRAYLEIVVWIYDSSKK